MKRFLTIALLALACSCQEILTGKDPEAPDYFQENIDFMDRTIYDNFSQAEYEPCRDAYFAIAALVDRYLNYGDLDAPGYQFSCTGEGKKLDLTTPMGRHDPWTDNHFRVLKGDREVLRGDIHFNFNDGGDSFDFKSDGTAMVDGTVYFGNQRIVIRDSHLNCDKHLVRTDFDILLDMDFYTGEVLLMESRLKGTGDMTVKIPLPDEFLLRFDIPGKLKLVASVDDLLQNKHTISGYYNGRAEKRVDLHFSNLRRFLVLSLVPALSNLIEDDPEESIGYISFSDEWFIPYSFEYSITPEKFPLTTDLLEGRY